MVGAAGESDLELLETTERLYKERILSRAYYSAFNPVPDTPLENRVPTHPLRQNRLYQASFLLRDYGFDMEELQFNRDGNLPLEVDPKLAWAKANFSDVPLEINQAERQDLLRLPGVGPKAAQAIINSRQKGKIRSVADLHKLGIRSTHLTHFVLFDGKSADTQLTLWAVKG